jgi:hypothetical protein
MNVDEFIKAMQEINGKILREIERCRKEGIEDLSKVRSARGYLCDAIELAVKGKLKDAEYKLLQAQAVLER